MPSGSSTDITCSYQYEAASEKAQQKCECIIRAAINWRSCSGTPNLKNNQTTANRKAVVDPNRNIPFKRLLSTHQNSESAIAEESLRVGRNSECT
jgi:hypothetical protein